MLTNHAQVVIRKSDGKVVCELTSQKRIDAVNRTAYRLVPILEHLQSLNKPKRSAK